VAGGDDNIIMIWTLEEMLKMGPAGTAPAETLDEIGSVEKWRIATVLRRHSEDVYDLAWSPDSTQLISGSVDKTCVIWVNIRALPLQQVSCECVITRSCDHAWVRAHVCAGGCAWIGEWVVGCGGRCDSRLR
jgi:WD40 repeat protein